MMKLLQKNELFHDDLPDLSKPTKRSCAMLLSCLLVLSAALEGRLRAVVVDVDGTIFPFAGRELSPANRHALTRCAEENVHTCLATGRIPGEWLRELKEQLPRLGPSVFANGALVCDATGHTIAQSLLPKETLRAVLDFTKDGTAFPLTEEGGSGGGRLCVLAATYLEGQLCYCELAPQGPSPISEIVRGAGEPLTVLSSLDGFEDKQVLKMVIWTVPGEEGWASMERTVPALRAALGDGADIIHHGARWCEVLPSGVNKGTGMLRALAELGVSAEEVLACGDAENDVEMLTLAGVGAAMGDGQPAAIAASDVVVAPFAADGVADAISRFVLSSEGVEIDFFTLDMCPYAQRVWIVLNELNVPYRRMTVNLKDDESKRSFIQNVNPRGKVPALRDSSTGVCVYESLIIVEYLAERFDGGAVLLPPEPAARARIRLWNEHLDAVLAPAHFTLLMNKEKGAEAAKSAALESALAYYEDNLVGPYLCGKSFTLADAVALPFFERLTFSLLHFKGNDVLQEYPRTRVWLDVAMRRRSFQITKRPVHKLISLYEVFIGANYSFGGLNQG